LSVSDVTGPSWRRSSHCGANGTCVEVAELANAGLIGVRDAKHGVRSPVLTFDQTEWGTFIRQLKKGAFDPVG